MQSHKKFIIITVAALFTITAIAADKIFDNKWQTLFPRTSKLTKVEGLEDGEEAYEVKDMKGQLLGWVLRSDSIDPKIKGKRGEISMLVAITPNGKISGVKVLDHKEDLKWFNKIKSSFYKSFEGQKVSEDYKGVDTVTGATVSSEAMIKDVFLSSVKFLENESVKEQLVIEEE